MARDQRAAKRFYVREWGRIILDDGHSMLNCVILDVSETGARLMISHGEVTEKCFLFRKKDDTVREATVVRRGNQWVGVRLGEPLDRTSELGSRLLTLVHTPT